MCKWNFISYPDQIDRKNGYSTKNKKDVYIITDLLWIKRKSAGLRLWKGFVQESNPDELSDSQLAYH